MAVSSDKAKSNIHQNKGSCIRKDYDLDTVSSHPWRLINDACEITCYLWSRSSHLSEAFTDDPSVYGSHGEGTATGLCDQTHGQRLLEGLHRIHVVQLEGGDFFNIDKNQCHPGFIHLENQSLKLKNGELLELSSFDSLLNKEPRGWTKLPLLMSSLDPTDARKTVTANQTRRIGATSEGEEEAELYVEVMGALPGPTMWPEEAEEWRSRPRPSGWPSPTLVVEVITQGYILVPVPHPTSLHPESEWRVSFPQAEKALFKSLDQWQRNCYMIVKLLCQEAFSGWTFLSSYHIKTMFLWMLEEYPAHAWSKSNIGQMACLLLDKIIGAISTRNLPCYFNPENNLIDHLSRDHAATCLQFLREIRRKPLSKLVTRVMHLMDDMTEVCAELLKLWDSEFTEEEMYSSLNDWCMIIAMGQATPPSDAWLYQNTLSYRPVIDIVLKMLQIAKRGKDIRYIDEIELQMFQDVELKTEEYQQTLLPDLITVYCALASHFRAKFHETTALQDKALLFEQTRELFERSVKGNDPPYDMVVAEYAGFLFDAGMYGESSQLLERPLLKTHPYNHYIIGYGYLQVEPSYFMLWVKFNLALFRGENVDPIIQKYEDMLQQEPKSTLRQADGSKVDQVRKAVIDSKSRSGNTQGALDEKEKSPLKSRQEKILLQLMKDKLGTQ